MRTKLFLAFIIIILAGLLSTVVFELLIVKDFDNYVEGIRDDQIHWIMISVEGSYTDGSWDGQVLSESIHWAMMMGLDVRILDTRRKEVIPSHHYIDSLSPNMKQRMEELFHIHTDANLTYNEFPLYSKGEKIGFLLARSFLKKELAEKEAIFKARVRHFLYFYLLIAGFGSILVGLLLVQFLSRPVRLLKKGAEKISGGDFSVRVAPSTSDEIGDLASAFNRMAESLQKEEFLRKQLMSNIAHELRTPLTIMKTHVEAISDGIIMDRNKGLDNIGNEIERLIALVRGIEDLTTAEASFFTRGETEQISLREFISGIVDDMLPAFNVRGLTVSIKNTEALLVRVDLDKLERVMRNILSNAMKFTDSGGVTIDYGVEGNRFFIDIADTGRGILQEDLPLVFNRFYRAAGSGADGLGVGLAIVRELVEVMGGSVTVKSRINEGSVFRITLPFAV
jgi:two-component system sensor histidine kinase BaeS